MLPKNGLEWLAGGNTVRRTANPRRFTPVPVSADLSETSVDDSTASESSASENAPDTVKSKKQRKLEKREAWEAVQAALTELSETSASDSDAEIQAVIKSRQQRKQEAKEAYGRRLENEGNERNGITKDKVCKCKVVHFDEESLLRARAQSTERKQELSIDSCTCDCVACNKALEEYLKVCGPSECQSKENTKRETKSCLKPSNRDTGSTKQQSGQPKQNICGCANNQQSDSASSKHSSPNNNDKDQQQRRINSLDQPKTNEDKVQQQSEVSDYYQQNNMSRLITESRAEVIIREDVIENPHLDPRPNAFYDAKCGVLRVYHGPNWGNATGSLIPVPASAFPPGNLPHMGPQPPPMFAPYMQFPMQPGGTPPFGFPYPHGYHPPPMHPNMSYGTIPNANPAELRPQSRNKGDDAPEKRDEGASPTRNNGKEKANTASTTSWDTSEPKSSSTMNSNVHAKPTGANEKPRPQWNTVVATKADATRVKGNATEVKQDKLDPCGKPIFNPDASADNATEVDKSDNVVDPWDIANTMGSETPTKSIEELKQTSPVGKFEPPTEDKGSTDPSWGNKDAASSTKEWTIDDKASTTDEWSNIEVDSGGNW